MNTDDQGKTRIRTSDAERERVAETLRNAVGEGRLTLQEGDERLAALYTTRFRDELPALVADLPNEDGTARTAGDPRGSTAPWASGPGPGPGGPGWAGPGWGGPVGPGVGWGAPGPHRWRLLRIVTVVLIIGGLITLAGGHFFWPIIPLLFLTFGIVRLSAWRCIGGGQARSRGRYGPWAGNDPGGDDPTGRGPGGRAS